MSLLSRVKDFFDQRTGYRALVAHLLDEPIRGGARWAYVFGSALLGTFLVQAITGAALMTSYAPSDQSAWASVHFVQFKQAGGWLLRGVHHYGAQAMVILLAGHLLQVALFGAYKKPREVTWWIGLALMALVLAFALTGYLLPWDQKGYWATRVATNIAGTVPVVGESVQHVLEGGTEYGSLTLTRFYALHAFVLPALVAGLVVVHVALFRRHGVTPREGANLEKVDAFFPKQLAKDLAAALAVLALVFALAFRTHGAGLDAPADPSSDYPARPEWYFLGLFQLLKYFHGPLEVVGTVVLPALAGAYLFALPLLDTKPTRALRARLLPLAPLFVIGGAATGLTGLALQGDRSDAKYERARANADARAELAVGLAMRGVPPEGPLAMLKRSPEARGPELFAEHCASCHTLRDAFGQLGDEAKRTAPRLDGWGTERWVLDMIDDPDGDARFGRTAYKGEMPSMTTPPKDATAQSAVQTWRESFKPMAREDMEAAAAFLASQGDEPGETIPENALRRDAARVARGKEIVTTRCTTCHLFEGQGDDADQGLAPELAKYGSKAWVMAQIRNPASQATYRANALDSERKGHMPRFDDELSQRDIELLAEWLRGRARGIAAPGRHVYPW